MVQGIVAFEIPVSRIEGKFKFGQNRSDADVQGVIDALSHSEDADRHALARMMAEERGVQHSDSPETDPPLTNPLAPARPT